MTTHRGMEKGLMAWWLAGPEERRTNSGFALGGGGGGVVNRKYNFFCGLCLVETTNKRGSTRLEMIDAGKGNIFC